MNTRKPAKTAIVVHLYHQDVWAFIAQHLETLQGQWDLHLTLSETTASQVGAKLQARFPHAQLHIYPNQGMDILPFLRLVPYLVEQGYQQLLKLHTKKGSTDFGPAWAEYLIDALIGHRQAITQAEAAFAQQPQLALLGPAAFFLSGQKLMLNNQPQLVEVIQHLASPATPQAQLPEQDWGFFAGSMFWTQPRIWLKLAEWAETQAPAFAADYAQDGQLPHALERTFGLLPALTNQPVGLLQPAQSGQPPGLQIQPAQQLLVNQAGSQKLIQAYQGLKRKHSLFTQAGLLDTAKYQFYLQKKGLFKNRQSLDLISHYLLIGQFSGGRYCSPAWKLHLQNQQINWPALASQKRQAGVTSIVMPVFNQGELTQQAVEAVVKHTALGSYELLLVDNGSDSSTKKLLSQMEKRHQAVKVHRLEKNLFFALGSNLGFAQAKGEYTVFLNNDTEVQANWLPPLLQALTQQAVYGAQPLLLYPDGSVQCMGVVFSKKSNLGYPIYRGMQPEECQADKPKKFQAITAACMAMHSELFAEAQGFDPIYINGQEDIDLCLRLKEKTQRQAAYVPNSQVIHYESKTPGRSKHIDQNRWVFALSWSKTLESDDIIHYRSDGFSISEAQGDRKENLEISAIKPVVEKIKTLNVIKKGSSVKVTESKLKKANRLYAEGKYREALELYKVAHKSTDGPLRFTLSTNIKICERRAGLLPSLDRSDWLIEELAKRISTLSNASEPALNVAKYIGSLFNPEWYTENNRDVKKSAVDPYEHYAKYGFLEGRMPAGAQEIAQRVDTIVKSCFQYQPPSCDDYENIPVFRNGGVKDVCVCYNSGGNFFFQEIAEYIRGLLAGHVEVHLLDQEEVLGTDFECYILVAPHEAYCLEGGEALYSFLKEKMPSVYYYLTEQPQTTFFNGQLKYLLDDVHILELNLSTARFLRGIGISAYYCPLDIIQTSGYSDFFGFSEDMDSVYVSNRVREFDGRKSRSYLERPVDICFIGNCFGRRSEFFAKNASLFSRLESFVFAPVWSTPHSAGGVATLSLRDSLAITQRSKIFLNIHRDSFHYFEWHRIVLRGIVSGTVVVTEPVHSVPGIVSGVHYLECEIDDIPRYVNWLLYSDEGRKKLAYVHERITMLLEDFQLSNSIAKAVLGCKGVQQ